HGQLHTLLTLGLARIALMRELHGYARHFRVVPFRPRQLLRGVHLEVFRNLHVASRDDDLHVSSRGRADRPTATHDCPTLPYRPRGAAALSSPKTPVHPRTYRALAAMHQCDAQTLRAAAGTPGRARMR